ncbi:hypothetical protein ACFSBZ_10870 [Amnibacterium flavum]|uniref:Uncharacterized protein n=1 Tax=Amnibacterium flavum TaxID=2173173 RepID=A0A2V1HRW3_9MICO|nr:hypothetical protein [Amnibacterium flavum]PVZ95335.1 hypothetical protein DDQ50_02095 [Amnibacterium flavum]
MTPADLDSYNPPPRRDPGLLTITIVSTVAAVVLLVFQFLGLRESEDFPKSALLLINVAVIVLIYLGYFGVMALSLRDLRRSPGIHAAWVVNAVPGLTKFLKDDPLSSGSSISSFTIGLVALTDRGVEFRRVVRSDEVITTIPWDQISHVAVAPVLSNAVARLGPASGAVLRIGHVDQSTFELGLDVRSGFLLRRAPDAFVDAVSRVRTARDQVS